MFSDLGYALRSLLRQPSLALGAVLACALGVGAVTAVFSVVDRILFRPLPYHDESRLVSVGILAPLDSHEFIFMPSYLDLRRDGPPFESVTAFEAGASACDLSDAPALRLRCMRVDANFLPLLGISPAPGRNFSEEENRPGASPTALVAHHVWRTRFASDPALPGKTFLLDGLPTRVAGVLPARFEMPTLTEADILLPLAPDEARERGAGRTLRAFARLKPGIDAPQAALQLGPYFQRLLETVPPRFRAEVRLQVQSVRERQTAAARPASLALLGAVIAVLLIACANIANLLLARAASRDREMAIRTALGASRLRLIRIPLAESLLLAVAGGLLGIGFAYLLLRVAVSISPGAMPRLAAAAHDVRVLLFALAATIATGLFTGLVPALLSPARALPGSHRGVSPGSGALRNALVTFQIAASMMLLTSAGLLIRSLWNLENVRLGLEPGRVITAHFTLGRQRYARPADQAAFFRELERRLAAIPGLDAAAITDSLPPSGGARGRPFSTIDVAGRPPIPEGTGGMVTWRYVSAGYFAAFSIPIKRGRGFVDEDRAPDAYSLVLSESLARRMFPNQDPLGKQILRSRDRSTGADVWFTVAGVAADVRNSGLAAEAAPEYYLLRKPLPDLTFANAEPPTGWREAYVVARTGLDPQAIAATLKDTIQSLDPTVPVATGSMRSRIRGVTATSRFQSVLLATFGLIGILLASIGCFAVTAFLVAGRRREMGIRLALGASGANVQWLFIRRAALSTAVGLAMGFVGSIAAARSIRSMLFDVSPLDPAAVVAAAVLLAGATCAAAWLPARRAANVRPAEILSAE